MYKATVFYGHPRDPRSFDRHYDDVHIPLASRMQGIVHWTITRAASGPDGAIAPFYLVAELYARTRSELLDAFSSPEGLAAAADVRNFADGGVEFFFGEEQIVTTSELFRRER